MTKQDYIENIKEAFDINIKSNSKNFKDYSYCNHKAENNIKEFKEDIKAYGMCLSHPYHENGIGNNNECSIYVEKIDSDGFPIKKEIAIFYYCYGIFGGVSVFLKDAATKEIIGKLNFAR